ncbi:elongator complex protein 3 [Nanoarchaeota archaeon]
MSSKRQVVRKRTKTLSGVTPIAVAVPPRLCDHGTCTYCPSLGVSQSYTPKSSTITRAEPVNYDPGEQIRARLRAFHLMGQPVNKIELIILGGTFLQCTKDFQQEFVKKCFDALNGKKSKDLKQAKKVNQNAEYRCIALCVETRPDTCERHHINQMLDYGATRCELGVQALDDEIYKKVNRGHTVQDVIDATKRLKDAGFKVGYHMMPGLPGSNPKKDFEMFKEIFKNPDFRPDQIKIYPTQIMEGSALAKTYKKMNYKPYTNEQLINLVMKIKQITPSYVRIMRVMREFHKEFVIGEPARLDLRKEVKEIMDSKGLKCNCIRCREFGFVQRNNKMPIDTRTVELKVFEYTASGEEEIFLEFSNSEGVLFGICRLRVVGDSLYVRELHVYGPQVVIGEKRTGEIQHKGFGIRLMKKAEKIAKQLKCKRVKVISGVGVREYYRKLGYRLEDPYMVKKIDKLVIKFRPR